MATIRTTHRRSRAELSPEPAPRPGSRPGGPAGGPSAGEVSWRRPARAVRPLWAVAGALVVVGTVVRIVVDRLRDDPSLPQYWLAEGARLVDLDAEANIPTWFSVIVLALVAAGFAAGALLVRTSGARAWPLAVPAVVAAYLSLDELASLHEELSLVADKLDLSAGLLFNWVVPGALLALAVGLVLVMVARRLSAWLRWRLVAAGVVYLTGALGFEVVTGWFAVPTTPGELEPPAQSVVYVLLNGVEEGLEMAGALIALWAVLSVLRVAVTSRGVLLDLDPARPALSASSAARPAGARRR